MNHTRQLDILNPELIIFPITIIGCGGIGSPTAITLAKVGCQNLTLIDPDEVEEHNLPNQFFRLSDIDKTKVRACQGIISQFTECSIRIVPELFIDQNLSGVVISGVDSMKARKNIWSKIRYNLEVPLYIDGRIGGETLEIFTIRPNQLEDIEFYEQWLFTDEETAELPCTARAIMYTGFIIGGLISSQLKKWLKQEEYYKRLNFDLVTMTQVLQQKVEP